MKHFQRQRKRNVIEAFIFCIITILICDELWLNQVVALIVSVFIVVNGILSMWDFYYDINVKNDAICIIEGKRIYQFELSSIKIDRGIMTIKIADQKHKMIFNANDEVYEYIDDQLIRFLSNQKNTS